MRFLNVIDSVWFSGKLRPFNRPAFHIVLIALLGLIAYSNTFGVPFQFDDGLSIVENPLIKNLSNLPEIIFGGAGPFASRPLMHITVALNYYFGGLDARGYHIVNLILHLINATLLYFLIVMTGRSLRYADDGIRPTALLASLLFVAHPIQTQAVTYIVSRSMLLSTSFYLSGMMLFLKAVTAEKRKGLFVLGLLATSLLGMASRENFATFPLMLVLYDLFFISRFRLKEVLKHYKAYAPALLSIGYLAYLVLNSTYDTGTDFPGMGVPHRDYFLTQFSVNWTYLRLLVLPINQNLDYDYPIAGTLFEFHTLFSFIAYLGLWVGAIFFSKKRPVEAFSVLWFLIILLPISFLVTLMDLRLDDLILEHRVYLPGVAFFVIAGAALATAFKGLGSERLRRAAVAVAVILPLLLATATLKRNVVWQSEISLWKDTVMKSPLKARPHYNLGYNYSMKRQLDMAMKEYRAAIGLNPDYVKAHNNLGIIYGMRGQFDKAVEELQTTIRLKPDYAMAHNNLGNVYKKMGRLDIAIEKYQTAIELQPDYAKSHFNLGLVLEEKGLSEKAIEQYNIAIRLEPDNVSAHNNLGALLADRGQLDKAIEQFQTVIKLKPNDATAHGNLAVAYQMMGLNDKAEEHFRKARELGLDSMILGPDQP